MYLKIFIEVESSKVESYLESVTQPLNPRKNRDETATVERVQKVSENQRSQDQCAFLL